MNILQSCIIIILAVLFLGSGCLHHDITISKNEYERCWHLCGKGGELHGVSPDFCFCRNGDKIRVKDGMRATFPDGYYRE